MCKHEFTQEEWIVEVCKNCGKLQQEIELEQQLAAANARIAELEKHFEQAKDKIAMMGAEIVRLSEGAEQAEAQCAAWIKADEIRDKIQELRTAAQFEGYGAELEAEETLPKLWEEYNKLTSSNAGTTILAENKRMREALGKIIAVTSKCLSHEEMKDKMKGIAKAALEEK